MLYWKLEKISCALVSRNEEWFKANVPEMENIWKIIEHERINGYSHRQPNRRSVSTNATASTNIIVKKIPEMNLSLDTSKMNLNVSQSEPKCLIKIVKM